MSSYGLSADDLVKIIATELERMNNVPEHGVSKPMDRVMGTTLTDLIRSVAVAIKENNAKLAEQIIAELRGGGTPAGRG